MKKSNAINVYVDNLHASYKYTYFPLIFGATSKHTVFFCSFQKIRTAQKIGQYSTANTSGFFSNLRVAATQYSLLFVSIPSSLHTHLASRNIASWMAKSSYL